MSIVTVAEVRSITGAPTSLIDDTEVQNQINLVEAKVKDYFDIALTPTKKIETLTGEFKSKLMVEEYFPLTVYKVLNGGTTVDLSNIFVHTEKGLIEINGDSISGGYPYAANRFSNYDLDIKVKYLYGAMQKDNTIQTQSSAAVSAGSSVSIEVADSSDFTVNDYVFIEDDTSIAKEVFKITTIADGTHITAEILVNDYNSSALITKAKTHELFKQYVLYETSLAVAMYAVGSSYTIATSYSFPEYTITKGVPYPHWEKSANLNQTRRNEVHERIKQLLGTIV